MNLLIMLDSYSLWVQWRHCYAIDSRCPHPYVILTKHRSDKLSRFHGLKRKVTFFAALTAAGAGFIELFCLCVLMFASNPRGFPGDVRLTPIAEERGVPWQVRIQNPQSRQRMILNPFFGYTFLPNLPHDNFLYPGITNNYGFMSDHKFPIAREPNQCVVGLFGGSVANQLGDFDRRTRYLSEALRAKIPAFKDCRVVVANLALPAARQPQQFFASAFFVDMLDMAIHIEGFNELYGSGRWQPAEYPNATAFLRPEDPVRQRMLFATANFARNLAS
ncbi:MAG TPA: hypothetical protein VFV50_04165, partial [Bdellovibrionales bacterium]|nr:hypothetical protein [Bdellovibrionales bacterium]